MKDFRTLTEKERREFIARRPGFLCLVVAALERGGHARSLPTVSRTWNGQFRTPNPVVVEVIQELFRAELRKAKAA